MSGPVLSLTAIRFYTYYWGISRTNVGSDFDNTKYPGVKPFTWEDFMRTRSIEQLSGGVN